MSTPLIQISPGLLLFSSPLPTPTRHCPKIPPPRPSLPLLSRVAAILCEFSQGPQPPCPAGGSNIGSWVPAGPALPFPITHGFVFVGPFPPHRLWRRVGYRMEDGDERGGGEQGDAVGAGGNLIFGLFPTFLGQLLGPVPLSFSPPYQALGNSWMGGSARRCCGGRVGQDFALKTCFFSSAGSG